MDVGGGREGTVIGKLAWWLMGRRREEGVGDFDSVERTIGFSRLVTVLPARRERPVEAFFKGESGLSEIGRGGPGNIHGGFSFIIGPSNNFEFRDKREWSRSPFGPRTQTLELVFSCDYAS